MYKSKNILYPIISLLTVVIQGTIFVSAIMRRFSVFYCREHSFGNNTGFQYMPGTLQHNRKNQNHLKKTK